MQRQYAIIVDFARQDLRGRWIHEATQLGGEHVPWPGGDYPNDGDLTVVGIQLNSMLRRFMACALVALGLGLASLAGCELARDGQPVAPFMTGPRSLAQEKLIPIGS